MPALPPVPSTLFVRLRTSLSADLDVLTRWFFTYTGTPPMNAACVTIASDVMTFALDEFVPYMPTTSALEEVEVTDLTSPTSGTGVFVAHHAGTNVGGPIPANACVLANLTIARRYRGGKPRRYLPIGTDSDMLSPQTWESASLANWLAAFNAFIADCETIAVSGTNVAQHVNVSYYESFTAVTNPITGRTKDVPKLRTGGPVIDAISGVSINPKIASQRRRTLIRS